MFLIQLCDKPVQGQTKVLVQSSQYLNHYTSIDKITLSSHISRIFIKFPNKKIHIRYKPHRKEKDLFYVEVIN